ncbi:hypothetical protein QAD02_013638 [Eretmocerus hayati]|uniref:Uncharacterized protein n=1 Tax=Eretmocerus hayati TaxID=131215 RepID=A0ACC2P458_9HYME|nr:hypothetical protein QAD02_013638 [Eretmocerus hayati]
MPKIHSRTTFQDEWLDSQLNPDYFWVKKAKSKYVATCRLCSKTFDISNRRKPSLNFHAKGVKHRQNVKIFRGNDEIPLTVNRVEQDSKLNSTVQPRDEETTEKREVLAPSTHGSSVTFYVSKEDVIDAEIYWALDHVSSKSL